MNSRVLTTPAQIALEDVRLGLGQAPLAFYLARDDIRQRYARTFLGPLWLVLSTGVWLGAMGLVMASLFNQDIHDYFPYMATGMLLWMLISGALSEGCGVMLQASALIYHHALPISIHYLRFLFRTAMVAVHFLLLLVLVFFIFPPAHAPNLFTALLGLTLLMMFLTGMTACLSLLALRYRDVQMALISVLQVVPFLTPVVWRKDMLHRHPWIADWNPFYHLLEVVRGPLLGEAVATQSWTVALLLAAGATVAGLAAYVRYRHRIIYWL